MPDSPRAFVSYSRADSAFALRLVEDLKAAGANVWLDQLDIEPGTPWDSAIENALLSSGHLLVILSNVSVTSDNVRDEISYALGQQMKVIPVLHQDCKVPFRLARLQHIDFRNDYPTALNHLLRTLRVATTPKPPPELTPEQELEQEGRERAYREEQKQAEERYREEERKRAAERREEERKQQQQVEVTRKIQQLHPDEPTRIALEAIRQSLAEPETQTTIPAESQTRNLQEHTTRTVTQPKPPQKQSPAPSTGRIALLAIGSGIVRILAAAMLLAATRQVWSSQFLWITSIATAVVGGLIICFVLLRFKPQLSGKTRPVLSAWVLAGLVIALSSLVRVHPHSPAMILLLTVPPALAGAYIGRYLAQTLQPAASQGVVPGLIAIGLPVFLGQIAQLIAFNQSLSAVGLNETIMFISLLVYITEIALLLWFIRNWGRPIQQTA